MRSPAAGNHVLFVSIPWRGHNSQLIALADAMAARGHRVRYVLPHAARAWLEHAAIEHVPWQDDGEPDAFAPMHAIWRAVSRDADVLRGERRMFDAVIDVYPFMYRALRNILAADRPDLIVVDKAVVPAMDLAIRAGLPLAVVTRSIGFYARGARDLPEFGTGFPRRMTRWQRVANRWFALRRRHHFRAPRRRARAVRQAYMNDGEPDRLLGAGPMIVGSMFGIEIERPLPAWMHLVGPILPARAAPLDDSLARWLDDAGDRGVIYAGFGTLARLERWQVTSLARGLVGTGARVLWSMPADQQRLLPALPARVRIEASVPQIAVLAHPAVRAFVSHCGMNGLNEALYHGVPILALPMFGDQHYNAARLVDLGVAVRLDKRGFDARAVADALARLTSEPAFARAARAIGEAMRGERGLDRAVAILERCLDGGHRPSQ